MKLLRTSNKRRGVFLPLLGSAFIACLLAGQLQAATIRGVIQDSDSQSYLNGALVSVGATGLKARTNRKGEYVIHNVPDGSHGVRVTYSGYHSDSKQLTVSGASGVEQDFDLKIDRGVYELASFTVESIPLTHTRALNQQKAMDSFANIISSDVIGNLPDSTLGQALNRIAGINVVDDNKVSIRGNNASLNSITLDGNRLNTPNEGSDREVDRSLDLSNIPAEIIGGIEVYKVLMPDMDADSFGGTVNIITKGAFDFPGRVASITTKYLFYDYEPEGAELDSGGYSISLNYGEKLTDNFGIYLTASIIDEQYWEERQSIRYYDPNSARVRDIDAITDTGVREVDRRVSHKDSKRISLNATFDFRLGEDSTFFIKLYSMDNTRIDNYWRLRMKDFRDFNDDSTEFLQSGTEARVRKRREKLPTENKTQRIVIGGESNINDWNIEYSALRSKANNDFTRLRTNFQTINRSGSRFRDANDWSVDRTDPLNPIVTVTINDNGGEHVGKNAFLVDEHLELTQIRDWRGRRNVTYTTARIDAERYLPWERLTKLKFGLKYMDSERVDSSVLDDRRQADRGEDGYYLQAADFKMDSFVPVNTWGGVQQTLGTYADIDDVFAFRDANPDQLVDRFQSAGNERLNAGENNYELGETITSAYGMMTQDYGNLRMIYGARYEETEFSALWAWSDAPADNLLNERNYGNFFPSVIGTFRHGDNHVYRAAWTNTVSRPNLNDLIPRDSDFIFDSEDPGQPGIDRLGNLNLGAQKSMNWDMSYDYFYKPAGNIGVAIFRKDISDFIYVHETSELRDYVIFAPGEEEDGMIDEGLFRTQQRRNGASQTVQGVEFNWQQQLNFLPDLFKGLGISFNYTLLKGESEFLEEISNPDGGLDINVLTTQDYILSQPKKMYNFELYYEKGPVTLRTAYNYRGEFVRSASTRSQTTPIQALNQENGEWDVSASYDINDKWRITMQLKDLTNEYGRDQYLGTFGRPTSQSNRGESGNISVRARF